jgi:hypothetical protein
VNDVQTWTLIAGFLAIMVAMSGLLLRLVKAEIKVAVTSGTDALRGDFGSLREEVARIGAKVDHLDRDVQSVVSRLMGDGPGTA